MRIRARAFSIVELLTVIAVISILVGLTVPALTEARWHVKELGVRNDLRIYDLGLQNFSQDMGFYPPSNPRLALMKNAVRDPTSPIRDQGAHILFETLMGLDRRGYQKEHFYGLNLAGDPYKVGPPPRFQPLPTERYGPYIEENPERIGEFHQYASGWVNDNELFVDGLDFERPRPILYYRANTHRNLLYDIDDPYYQTDPIYEYMDNEEITALSIAFDRSSPDNHPDGFPDLAARPFFFKFIHNPQTGLIDPITQQTDFTSYTARPFNPDTFILISAGRDGVFGPNPEMNYRNDDITNFNR